MAFKKIIVSNTSIESPEALFGDLRNRNVQGLLAQQADILREYLQKENCSDLAIRIKK